MLSTETFANLYLFYSRRRPILYTLTVVAIIFSILIFWRLDMHEDIRSMLPDDNSRVAQDFELLQHMPFAAFGANAFNLHFFPVVGGIFLEIFGRAEVFVRFHGSGSFGCGLRPGSQKRPDRSARFLSADGVPAN